MYLEHLLKYTRGLNPDSEFYKETLRQEIKKERAYIQQLKKKCIFD
jgi:hypothetical protein